MAEIETVTLYREKSVVHKLPGLGDDDAGQDNVPVLTLRSNRVTIPYKTKINTIMIVVRGQNIPGTMRMTSVVIDEIRRDPQALSDPRAVDWETLWRRKVSKFENDYNPQNWVSLHIGGDLIFASDENRAALAHVEAIANGADVTDTMIQEAAATVLGELDELVVEHDTQTAFVFTPFAQYLRAAILERRDRKTGSYSMAVYHPAPSKPVRLSHFISFCADITEALTHKAFLDRVQELIAENALQKTNITPALTQATRNRRRDLIGQIESFEEVNKVIYRPERPNLM